MQVTSDARVQAVVDGPLQTKPITPYLGVEVLGLDLERPLSAAVEDQLRALWIEYGVLLVRGAGTSPEAQMRLSRVFGDMQPSAHGAKRGLNLADNPYMLDLNYDPSVESVFSGNVMEVGGKQRVGWLGWHWDQAFMPVMVHGRVLRAVSPAAVDGRTGFSDAIAAYYRLPEALRERVENLEIVYEYQTRMEENRFGFPEIKVVNRNPNITHPRFEPTVHPLIVTQKETGRKVLNLSPMHARYILGMENAEGDALLKEVADYLVDDRYSYFHKWDVNDMITWDNWRIIHAAEGVPPGCPRRMHATTIVGDYGFGRYLDPALKREDAGYTIND